jgi:2-oxo-hept-3-ene-1,7-dioate hydratase
MAGWCRRPLHRHPHRGRARLRDEVAAFGTGLHDVRRAQRHRFRGARAGNLDTRVERVDPQTKATRKIFDTIADNAANAGIVLGGRPIRPMDADLRWIGALCFRNGQLEETGLAAGVLNHPATSVAWLANKIAPNGLALEAGQVVLAGSFIRPIETRKGDTIQADYGPYGSVSCYFA